MNSDQFSVLGHIISIIFRNCWPVWKAYVGNVPDEACRQLELEGDWPPSVARKAMQRISSDADLRRQLEEYC